MPDRSRKKRPHDLNLLAENIVKAATEGEPEAKSNGKNPHAVALGRLGGKKGGKARAAKLSPTRRHEIAKRAAQIRWAAKTDEG